LTPRVYDELLRLARSFMPLERGGRTIQATALVHEAYLRLIDVDNVDWEQRAHFFAVCAQVMRRILLEGARRRATSKRAEDGSESHWKRFPASRATSGRWS
jgi:hypothetical protein